LIYDKEEAGGAGATTPYYVIIYVLIHRRWKRDCKPLSV